MKSIKHIYLTGNKPLKVNKNNIETYLPIFTGFYGSEWDEPDFYGEAEHYNLPEKFDFADYINWTEYKEELSKAITNKVEELLSDFVEVIEYQNLSSPQYYNFSNDSINCIIRPKKQAIRDYIYANLTQFDKYLQDNYKSRDGFISSYSWDFNDWIYYTKNFTDYTTNGHYLGAILNFIAEQEKIEYIDLYYGTENVYISNFYTPEFYEIVEGKINEIKPFIQENYNKVSNDELMRQIEEKYEQEETLNLIVQTAQNCIKDIENNTMKLELK